MVMLLLLKTRHLPALSKGADRSISEKDYGRTAFIEDPSIAPIPEQADKSSRCLEASSCKVTVRKSE